MPGDRAVDEAGTERGEFRNVRGTRAVRFVPQRTAAFALLGGMLTGGASTGAVANFVFKAAVQAEIRQHDKDPEAHYALLRAMERVQAASTTDDAEKARLQAQLDDLQRKVNETREIVIELRARVRAGR